MNSFALSKAHVRSSNARRLAAEAAASSNSFVARARSTDVGARLKAVQ